mgnify:CR=1 FL=1
MSKDHHTRRCVLRRLGTASAAIVPALSGCLDSGSSDVDETPTSTPTSTPSITPDPRIDDVDADAWREYGPKPYARFSPQPSVIGETGRLTCTLPAVTRQHSEAFGDAKNRFTSSWVDIPPGAFAETTYFNIHTHSTICIGGAFDKDPVVDRFEAFSFEKLDPYGGFDLYAGSTSGVKLQVTAVQDGWVLIAFPSDIPDGKRKIRHLIDLCREETTPHSQSSDPFGDVAAYLPQGVFTRVYPDISELNLRLSGDRLETAGETLRFDGQHTPATGIVVLRFRDGVDDPKGVWEESSEWLTSFMRLSLPDHEVEIRVPSDRTLVLEGPVDPETVFGT